MTPDDDGLHEFGDEPMADASDHDDGVPPARRVIVPGSGGSLDPASIARRIGLNFGPSFAASLGSLHTPTLDFSRFGESALSPAVAEIGRIVSEQTIKGTPLISPSWFDPIVDAIRTSLLHISFPDPTDLEPDALPANIGAAAIDYEPDTWLAWISEGLVVAAVPDPGTLELIAAADGPAERRKALSSRADEVLAWSESLLDDITAADLEPFVIPARRAVNGIQAGFDDLAQAYAASTLETIQLLFIGRGHYGAVRDNLDQATAIRDKLHLAQVERVFRSYKDAVPTTFNRHGSSHAVGLGQQYSRLNAVLAVGHLVSAMWKYELDTLDAHR